MTAAAEVPVSDAGVEAAAGAGAEAPAGSEVPAPVPADDAVGSGGAAVDVPSAAATGGTTVYFPDRDQYYPLLSGLRHGGFELLSDLCAVDYLTHPGRHLPDGVAPERFEVAVVLRSVASGAMVRARVQVPESDPEIRSVFDLYPGADAMEREAYDMFGIRFVGHPDLTRILMPEDWEGHPLRKDYAVGRVPVQFKEAPGPR